MDVVRTLNHLRKRLLEFYSSVDRKHWRPSEKAMAKAMYADEVAAIDAATLAVGLTAELWALIEDRTTEADKDDRWLDLREQVSKFHIVGITRLKT